MKEFFGFGGYMREAEGYMSWQHLTFVSALVCIMIICAVLIGRKLRNRDEKAKNKVLVVTAFLIDGFELFKIILICVMNKDPMRWVYVLPLFLCSIQLIAIPIAAFSKGRIKESALDFVMIFGLLGAILGTYFAGNNYACYPVISFDNVVSGITHCLAGFAALYIMVSGMNSMKKRNIHLTMIILGAFCVAAYIANIFTDCNYMFLSRGDGTPYDIIFNLVGGHPVVYPVIVVGLFVLYIGVFYYLYYLITKKMQSKNKSEQEQTKETANV
ncbi:MAG: YwaF family protein [Clostridia bacterium]|nr:YwaF family protein [Clostridia bacterium]